MKGFQRKGQSGTPNQLLVGKEFIGKIVNAMDRQTTLCCREMLSRVQAPITRDRHEDESSEERSGPRCQKWCICLYLSEDWGTRLSDSQGEGRERGGEQNVWPPTPSLL